MRGSWKKLESKHTLNPAAQDPNSAHTSCSCAVKQHCSGLARPYQDVTVESLNGVLTSSESTTIVFIDTVFVCSLNVLGGLDEPNLVFVLTGMTEPLTLEGFPPWQIRLSELWYVVDVCLCMVSWGRLQLMSF